MVFSDFVAHDETLAMVLEAFCDDANPLPALVVDFPSDVKIHFTELTSGRKFLEQR